MQLAGAPAWVLDAVARASKARRSDGALSRMGFLYWLFGLAALSVLVRNLTDIMQLQGRVVHVYGSRMRGFGKAEKAAASAMGASLGMSSTSQQQGVLLVMAMTTDTRTSPRAQKVLHEALSNREQYASVHGYGVYVSSVTVRRPFESPWNKIEVLSQAMDLHPHMQWFLLLDNDALFVNMSRPFLDSNGVPTAALRGMPCPPDVDIIIHANATLMYDTHPPGPNTGINSGVVAVRNTAWARAFLAQLTEIGTDWTLDDMSYPCKDGQRCHFDCFGGWCTKLKKFFGNKFFYNVYDQNGWAFLLHDLPLVDRLRVFFADWNWNYTPPKDGKPPKHVPTSPYVMHWAGCSFGNDADPLEGNKTICYESWEAVVKRTNSDMQAWERQRLIDTHPSIYNVTPTPINNHRSRSEVCKGGGDETSGKCVPKKKALKAAAPGQSLAEWAAQNGLAVHLPENGESKAEVVELEAEGGGSEGELAPAAG